MIMDGKEIPLFGDGSLERDYTHIDDTVEGILRALDAPEKFDVFNIGNPAEITVLDLARTVIARTGSASDITFVPFADVFGEGFEEINRRVPDITKAQAELGFSPSRTLESVIDEIAQAVTGAVTGEPRQEAALSLAMAGHHDV